MTVLKMNNTIRQIANLVLAPLMWILSTLPQVTDWGRSASEFSDQNDSLLVPYGLAFSIWFPIFVLCIGYGITQARPSQKENPIFQAAGPWTALGFLGVSLWALISAHAPENLVLWGTAIVFVPTVFSFVRALLILLDKNWVSTDMTTPFVNSVFAKTGIGMIAGWTSLAMFLNWTPLMGQITQLDEIIVCAVMLVIALILIATVLKKTGGYLAYAIPPIWGLCFLAFERFQSGIAMYSLGVMAVIGAIGLAVFTAYLKGRHARS